ncbi:MAG TPA: hypothetical protein VF465_12510 [Flavobacterium sp.]|uniref:hypothetical protein n=1 Tax=Flavobacterium sp. TaxID=239 RepID=UPI002ED0F5E4
MYHLYAYLNQKYGASTEIRMFFTTRTGHHNHFVIYIEDKKLHEQIVADIQDYFNYDRIDLSFNSNVRSIRIIRTLLTIIT